jgi:SP family myo-inositol transporter-like MFS transporter 13
MFGFDTGYISAALVSIGTDLGSELSYGQEELITSATSLGALCGAAITSPLADNLGRKYTSMGANIFLMVGAIVQLAAHSVWTMIAGRFVMGWGVGIGSVIAPLFITELAPPRWRGRLVTISSIIRTGAQLFAYAIGAGLEHVHNGWRILIGISLIPCLAQLLLLIPLPDSPRFLVQKGRIIEATRALQRTHNGASDDTIAIKVAELVDSTRDPYEGYSVFRRFFLKLKELHTVPSNFRGLIIVCGGQGINQFTGFNSLMYFSATIFQIVGFSNSTAVSIVVAGTNFVFTVAVYFLVDRVGRRKLMLWSLAGMTVSFVLNAVAFHFLDIVFDGNNASAHGPQKKQWGDAVIVFMILFVAFFAVGCGAIPWQQSEVFPMSVRGLGSSFACCTNWAGSLTVAATFLTMMKNITPPGTFAFFAAISLVSWIFLYFTFPELANLGLEETQMILSDGFNIKKSIELSKARRHKD